MREDMISKQDAVQVPRAKAKQSSHSIGLWARKTGRKSICLLLLVVCLIQLIQLAHCGPRTRPPRGYCTPLAGALPKSSPCQRHLAAQPNELVYVRLETLGRQLADLRTTPINELVAQNVIGLLLGNNKKEELASASRWIKLRAQLVGVSKLNGCSKALEALVCRLAYPSCHFRRADVSALVRPPCREDCLLARDVMCANLEWSLFAQLLAEAFNTTLAAAINELDLESQRPERNGLATNLNNSTLQLDSGGRPSVHFYWPHERSLARCESLPSLRLAAHRWRRNRKRQAQAGKLAADDTDDDGRAHWPICSSSGLQRIGKRNGHLSDDCLMAADGTNYSATINHTSTGLECQPWASQKPHQHPRSELLFDSMREAHNYCRNPGNLEPKPWCYTKDPKQRWQYCDPKPCK